MLRTPFVYVALVSMVLVAVGLAAQAGRSGQGVVRVEITYGKALKDGPLDGRLLVMLSTDPGAEPRFQINDSPGTQVIAGIDVDGWRPGQPAVVDGRAVAYPLQSLDEIPPGTYTVQALLQVYETFHRADGKVVKLPMDHGEGRQWNRAPGNLYSTPQTIRVTPGGVVRISLDQVIPPVPDPPETKYIKHVRIQSEKLTKFWGRPMFLGAHVLLPAGFDEHPGARYPLVIDHGHFPYTFEGFREEAPDPDLKPVYSERFHWEGYNRTEQEQAHQLYKDWTSPGFPRFLLTTTTRTR